MKRHNIWLDLLFTILTIGLFNVYIQIRQILDCNEVFEHERYSFTKMLIFSVLTIGIYFVYHEYKMTWDLQQKVQGEMANKGTAFLMGFLTFLGAWPIADMYQQSLLNKIN
jgi:hypothetical protein